MDRFAAAPIGTQDNETHTGKSRAEHDETNPRCYASLAIVAAVARLSLVWFTLVAGMVRSVNVHAGRGRVMICTFRENGLRPSSRK